MKTFEELLAENSALALRIQAQDATLKTAIDGLVSMKETIATLSATVAELNAERAQTQSRLAVVEPLAAKLTDATSRIVTLEGAKVEFEKAVALQVTKLGISTGAGSAATTATAAGGAETPEALLAAYQAEKDPTKSGELFKRYWKATHSA